MALRAELVRDGGPGLKHVEALLVLRGSNLPPVPRKVGLPNFRRGKLREAIYAAFKDGPLFGPEIVERVCAAHGLAYGQVYSSAYTQLGHMRRAGRVVQKDGVWRLDLLRGSATP